MHATVTSNFFNVKLKTGMERSSLRTLRLIVSIKLYGNYIRHRYDNPIQGKLTIYNIRYIILNILVAQRLKQIIYTTFS
jgi:hypothetical protein